jgi:signal transduction histidine kinase/DNA-binding response OmpR family regulator
MVFMGLAFQIYDVWMMFRCSANSFHQIILLYCSHKHCNKPFLHNKNGMEMFRRASKISVNESKPGGAGFISMITVTMAFLAVMMVVLIISISNMVKINMINEEKNTPYQQLLLLNSLVTELQSAENAARGYRLRRDTVIKDEFYFHASAAIEHTNSLHLLTENLAETDTLVNELRRLTMLKMESLELFAELDDRLRVVGEIEKVGKNVGAQSTKQTVIQRLISPVKGSRNRTDTLQRQMMEQLDQVRRQQRMQLSQIDQKELTAIRELALISGMIEGIVAELSVQALRMVEENAARQIQQQSRAIGTVRLFSLAALLFMLAGAFSLLSLLRQRRQYEKALQIAKTNAEIYSAMQERFVASMSHEVRTPLHAAMGFTEQLSKEIGEGRSKEYITLIQTAMHHLQQVTDDILDYSKLKAGKMQLMLQPFNPVDEADTVCQIFQNEFVSKGLDFSLKSRNETNCIILGDPLRFRQILLNLTSNALKFTGKGFVRIRLSKIVSDNLKQWLMVEVEDSGTGMTEEQIAIIFSPFGQIGNEAGKNHRGTGLGLTITRELVEQQGGVISVTSEPGIGTTFSLRLPFIEAAANQVLHEELVDKLSESETDLSKVSILVADDEEWNLRLAGTILTRFRATPVQVSDGLNALELLRSNHFDIALIDIRMPGLSGIEVVQKARNSSVPWGGAAIAVTAQVDADGLKGLIEKGFDDILTKPFSEAELLKTIQKHLPPGYLKIPESIDDQSSHEEDQPLLFNPELVSKMSANDKAFENTMMEIMIRNGCKHLKELEDAILQNNNTEIGQILHKLSPPLRQIGAHEILTLLASVSGFQDPILTAEERISTFNNFKISMEKMLDQIRICYKLP